MGMRRTEGSASSTSRNVEIRAGAALLQGSLDLPAAAGRIVLFAHGSGSSRHSPRNRYVAGCLQAAGIGTLLFDLLTPEEEAIDLDTRQLRFDIPLLARRLEEVTRWVQEQPETSRFSIGYFGASTGAAAALVAAADLGYGIGAVVSRGGRPDLAGAALKGVTAPTLLIVGGLDDVVLRMNREALAHLRCKGEIHVVAGATHLFEEPGALEEVARLAADWFDRHL